MRISIATQTSNQSLPLAWYAHREAGSPALASSTFEEERQEVLTSVLGAMGSARPDPDRSAACWRLLRHLEQSAPLR
jgi:hypothetical protein